MKFLIFLSETIYYPIWKIKDTVHKYLKDIDLEYGAIRVSILIRNT
jgi:uncharacterized hydantoinase/oxoprolinase family protein